MLSANTLKENLRSNTIWLCRDVTIGPTVDVIVRQVDETIVFALTLSCNLPITEYNFLKHIKTTSWNHRNLHTDNCVITVELFTRGT